VRVPVVPPCSVFRVPCSVSQRIVRVPVVPWLFRVPVVPWLFRVPVVPCRLFRVPRLFRLFSFPVVDSYAGLIHMAKPPAAIDGCWSSTACRDQPRSFSSVPMPAR
jgi:hypothetical protein